MLGQSRLRVDFGEFSSDLNGFANIDRSGIFSCMNRLEIDVAVRTKLVTHDPCLELGEDHSFCLKLLPLFLRHHGDSVITGVVTVGLSLPDATRRGDDSPKIHIFLDHHEIVLGFGFRCGLLGNLGLRLLLDTFCGVGLRCRTCVRLCNFHVRGQL